LSERPAGRLFTTEPEEKSFDVTLFSILKERSLS
jgi:hypothetical protein